MSNKGIENVILNGESIPLGFSDIKEISGGDTKVIFYHDLIRFDSIEELLKPYGSVIILFLITGNFGHWVALIDQGETLEFFDPLGLFPDSELQFVQKAQLKRDLEGNEPLLTRLLNAQEKTLVFNDVQLQQDAKDVNTCGRWAGSRVLLKDIPLESYVALFEKQNCGDPDFWVTAVTLLLTKSLLKTI